jgi:hypothetical protein
MGNHQFLLRLGKVLTHSIARYGMPMQRVFSLDDLVRSGIATG